ncbi:unnamed protein product [Pieris macdunnoughi]|uniref:Uncharacterized protein n=1 Tax=Pieris macdunnoughi TaxID=345717 RepID=A0A821QAR2_9NEOP|nr:unnamed protein product [Pieris macdunnoughi]
MPPKDAGVCRTLPTQESQHSPKPSRIVPTGRVRVAPALAHFTKASAVKLLCSKPPLQYTLRRRWAYLLLFSPRLLSLGFVLERSSLDLLSPSVAFLIPKRIPLHSTPRHCRQFNHILPL